MRLDPRTLGSDELYKVLSGLVVPRPIALVTSIDELGRVNAAPFSFFNILTHDPPVLAFGSASRADGALKDTPRNIDRTGEFVVHMVDETLVDAMAVCAVDFPWGVDELEQAGLTQDRSQTVAVPRIAGAPAAFECRLLQSIDLGPLSRITMGEISLIHVAEGCMDPDRRRVEFGRYRPIGRLFGEHYVRLTDLLHLPRVSPESLSTPRRAP